jgi:SAM-dependent methyltransferase
MSSGEVHITEEPEHRPSDISDQDSAIGDNISDQDSAIGIGDNDGNSDIISLTSAAKEFREERGRRYHSCWYPGQRGSVYRLPNDDLEQDRLDLEHHVFSRLQGGLFLAPLSCDPQMVLDLGTGTGIWAIEFADQYESATVIGIDLSPIQPGWTPTNLRFEVDNANYDWTYKIPFDYIHCRQLHNGVEIKRLLRQSFNFLNLGGWLEMTEVVMQVRSDDGSTEGTHLLEWCKQMSNAGKRLGLDFNEPCHYQEWMKEVGFVEVEEKVYKLPIGTWPKDENLKDIGRYEGVNLVDGLEALSLKYFCQYLEWSEQQLAEFLAKVRDDIWNRKIHAYFMVYCVFGRRPTQ